MGADNNKKLEEASFSEDSKNNTENDAKIEIDISKDEMEAALCIISPRGTENLPDFDTVLKELNEKNITHGLNYDLIKEMLAKRILNKPIKIASGTVPIDGKDGYVKYHFDPKQEVKPKILADGTVDYYNLGIIINVKKGQLIAEIFPPTKGTPGKTVKGKPVKAKNGREARIIIGKNVVMSDDKSKLFANIDGQPIVSGNKISVLPILEIKGDVGPATGNIDFLGSITVFGNVKSGFSIKSAGDVEINGIVEAAEIESDSNIIIKRGVQGQGKGYLKANGSITARYIENATAEAGENIEILDASMHSSLSAGKNITAKGKKGLIVGGVARAGEKIIAKTIGSPMCTYTELEVGMDPSLKLKYQELCNKVHTIESDLHKIEQAVSVLEKLREADQLSPEKETLLKKLLSTKDVLAEEKSELLIEKENLDLVISYSDKASISASDVCYAGVNIIIGNASLKIRDKINHVTFYNYGGQIKFGPYEG